MPKSKPNRDITAETLKEFDEWYAENFGPADKLNNSILFDNLWLFIEQALTKQKEELVKYVRDEVIGEDDTEEIYQGPDSGPEFDKGAIDRNHLRAQQRQKLDNLNPAKSMGLK